MLSRGIAALKDKPHFMERCFSRFSPYDHLVILYSWTIIIIAVNFARPFDHFTGLVVFHACALIIACMFSQLARPDASRTMLFFRYYYPIILMTLFYHFSGDLIGHVVHHYYDADLTALEKAVFGVNPTLWLDQHISIAVTELLSVAYELYYLMIPGLAVMLFISRKDEDIKRFVTASCVTFFVSYLMFLFIPMVGPRYFFDGMYQTELTGPVFRPLSMFIMDHAAFRGGAMPSSHVAEAIVVLFFAVRAYGRKGWVLFPVVLGLALGTVHGRFHYVSDVVAGIIMGIIIPLLTLKFYPAKRDYSRIWNLSDFDKKRQNVSDSI